MTSNPADVQDIVQILRDDNSYQPYTERSEAADEIERLRAALQQSLSAEYRRGYDDGLDAFRAALQEQNK